MYKNNFPSLFLFFLLLTINNPAKAQSDVNGTWNGTVSMVQKLTGITGTSTLKLDAVIHENVVTATMSFEGETKIGTLVSHVSCRGAGPGELHHLDLDRSDSTFYIHVIGTSYMCSPAEDGPGQDAIDITISDKAGSNFNSLNGSRTNVSDLPDVMKTTTTLTWSLSRVTADVELIVTPTDYDKWLPVPGKDEYHQGNVMNIGLKLQGKNGKPLTVKAKSFELKMNNTSVEPGITINYPILPSADQLPDLRFMLQPNAAISDQFQVITLDCRNCTAAAVKIGSYDGGGYTTLTATAILDDDTRITGNLLVPGGVKEILIPKRNGSMIGSFWLNAHGNPGDYDDKETSNGNKHDGDGLSAYEEYRGVISEGHHKRLDPEKKELGVTIPKSLIPEFAQGLDWFKQASDIEIVRFFYREEIGMDRKFNKNFSQGHIFDQDVIRVDKRSLGANTAGKAFTVSDKPDIPTNTIIVAISTDNIKTTYQQWTNWARNNNLQLLWTEKEYLAQTIAHELGHGVNVWHHGDDTNVPQGETATQGVRPVYHLFNRNLAEITARPYTIPVDDRVCPCGSSQAGGDLGCVMAYIDVCEWARIAYADGSVGLFQSPLLPIGKSFCKTKNGTGINSGTHTVSSMPYNNYFGKAEKGECLGQITLK
ncbi:MAG: hypothetical protein ABIT05_11680 [Chitinophagaceae bacterium]